MDTYADNNVPPAPQPSDLVVTLRRCCDALAKSADDAATPLKTLTSRRRGLVVATCFLSAAEQQPIGALSVDFVTAARWLSGYYSQAAQGLLEQARPTILGPNGAALSATAPQLSNVADAITATASMWREVVEAAQRPGYDEMIARYEAWIGSGSEPDAELLEYFGGVAPPTATYHGIVRLWTAVVASLCNTVTSGQARGGRQEVVMLTQVMVQTAREAAVMAAMLGREAEAGAQEPDVSDCKNRGTSSQRVCAEEGCGFCRAAERQGDEATS